MMIQQYERKNRNKISLHSFRRNLSKFFWAFAIYHSKTVVIAMYLKIDLQNGQSIIVCLGRFKFLANRLRTYCFVHSSIT